LKVKIKASKTAKKLLSAMKAEKRSGTRPLDTLAKVIKVDKDTAYVQFTGGKSGTPVEKTINCKPNDIVRVRVSNNKAWITGNSTAPPTDDTVAKDARNKATDAKNKAGAAQDEASRAHEAADNAQESARTAYNAAQDAIGSANEAKQSAYNANEYASRALGGLSTVQSVVETLTWITQHGTMTLTADITLDPTHVYFVQDPVGDYVVGGTHYSIVADPDVSDIGTYYELTIDESLNNYVGTHLALTGEGLWLLPAASGVAKILIATGAGTTYGAAGIYIIDEDGAIVTFFAYDNIRLGTIEALTYRVEITSSGFDILYRNSDNTDTEVAHIGINSNGKRYHTFGHRIGTIGNESFVAGSGEASGFYSFAEGESTTASSEAAHAEGEITEASAEAAHAEGRLTEACAEAAHAEGYGTKAGGEYGAGIAAHAEGSETKATSNYSHAEGEKSIASGYRSHAQNHFTVADQNDQTAIGRFNTKNNTNNLFAVGNGTDDYNRSDAFTVDKDGNTEAAGKISSSQGTMVGTDNLSSSGNNHSFSINAGAVQSQSFTITRQGYYPICIDRINLGGTGSDKICLNKCGITSRANGSVTYEVAYYNPTNTDYSSITVAVYVLWAKL